MGATLETSFTVVAILKHSTSTVFPHCTSINHSERSSGVYFALIWEPTADMLTGVLSFIVLSFHYHHSWNSFLTLIDSLNGPLNGLVYSSYRSSSIISTRIWKIFDELLNWFWCLRKHITAQKPSVMLHTVITWKRKCLFVHAAFKAAQFFIVLQWEVCLGVWHIKK